MSPFLMVGCILLSSSVGICPGDESPHIFAGTKPADPPTWPILREASEIALKQDEHQNYWIERVLLHIGEVQIRAGDFDGALKSNRGSAYPYGRNEGLHQLAEVLARDGKREAAFGVLHLMDSDWQKDYLHDKVQMQWIEHLIAAGDFNRAGKDLEQLKSDSSRAEGLRKLAVAFAKSGDVARAGTYFTRALETAAGFKEEIDRARGLWETADAQLTVGMVNAAKATIRKLLELPEPKDSSEKFTTILESAELTAKAKDEKNAKRLFRRALEAQKTVNSMNELNALVCIAKNQASVGYIDDALKTAALITHRENDIYRDGEREQALCAIALAQLKAKDVEGAVRTALSIKYYRQYSDDVFEQLVEREIAEGNLKTALTTAEKFDNPSKKATAILKVATAHAQSGNRKTAANVAARIKLTQEDMFPRGKEHFDYRTPSSWGVHYEIGFTSASRHGADKQAAEVAAAAMTLAQALGQRPEKPYDILFGDCNTEEVIQSLARAHAASGHASEALAWAKRIGKSDVIKTKNDDETLWAVERRIHALIGVAEGILDRSCEAPKDAKP
jgi:tetratricopeptide (TPR) repeat protein